MDRPQGEPALSGTGRPRRRAPRMEVSGPLPGSSALAPGGLGSVRANLRETQEAWRTLERTVAVHGRTGKDGVRCESGGSWLFS